MRKKRFILLTTIGSFLLGNSVNAQSENTNERPPNVVVFLVDDLGYMDIGPNNPDCFYDTPFLDAFAETAMRFTDGYAANPVCSPTRYSLLTGKYPTRVQATNFFSGKAQGRFAPAHLHDQMDSEEVTLAEALKEKGYKTFFAGKWHLGYEEALYPENQGFDINIGGYSKGGPYTGKRYFAPFENPKMSESPEGEHLPNRLATDTANFIDENKDKPFLAYLSFYSVHTPLMGPKDLVEKYEKLAKKVEGKKFALEEQVLLKEEERKVRVLQNHDVYAAMVESMDRAVGKVLQQIEDSGLADNTIVVFTSDNGGLATSEGSPTSNLPLRGGKGWVYEGGIREPWMFRYPGVTEPGSVSEEMICSIDLLPTLVNAAGAKMPDLVDGVDLRPALEGGSLAPRSLYWHYPHYSNQGGIPGGAIRKGDYKLFERYEDGRVHLYNLKDDIGEKNDLAEAEPERVEKLREELHQWYGEVDAQFLRSKEGSDDKPWRPSE